jgi:hypothetical protein
VVLLGDDFSEDDDEDEGVVATAEGLFWFCFWRWQSLCLLRKLVMVNTLFLVWLFYKVSYSSKKKLVLAS